MMLGNNKINFRQNGFSLVEIMVGLVIGLLATLVIMQVFSTFEGQKRTTSGNADAQTNGTIALATIQRNVQMAGYGMPLPMASPLDNPLRCDVFPDFVDPVSGNVHNIFPVAIQDAATANASDRLTVRYSTNAMGGLPTEIISATNPTTTGITVQSTMGCDIDANTDLANANDDIALIQKGVTCDIAMIDRVIGTAAPSGATGTPQQLVLSVLPQTNIAALTPGPNPDDISRITCMGDWQSYTFQVVNNQLQLNGQPIVSEVVTMQVQYGISTTPGQNNVTNWVDADAAGGWNNPTVVNRNRIKAIRLAIVLRNGLLERENVTAAAPIAWAPLNGSVAPLISLAALPDWQRYRYRVFETIIPLRNMIWSREAVL